MRRILVTTAVALLSIAYACTADDPPHDTSDRPDEAKAGEPSMTVTVIQQRTAEGTREIGVRVGNTGDDTFTVEAVRLVWSVLPEAPLTPKGTVFAPGSLIDLVTTYGRPDCSGYPTLPTDRPAAEIRLAGGRRLVPLDTHGRAWLRRLYVRECRIVALRQVADVRFDTRWTRTVVDGDPYLRSSIVLERNPTGPREPVTVVSLLGSVLLDYWPVRSGEPIATLAADQPRLRIPVIIGSSGLCTPHAFAESKQTFLLNTYVRHGDASVQRVILTPDRATQIRLLRMVREACRG